MPWERVETGAPELFICTDCPERAFADKAAYNRHRNQHERPYPCLLCELDFALKTDLDRHRQTHRGKEFQQAFKCQFPGCKSGIVNRADNLRQHVIKKHKLEIQQSLLGKTLQEYLKDLTKEQLISQNDRDLQLLEAANQGETDQVRLLLSEGADESMTNEFDQTAFYLAVAKGHLEIVALLCKDTAAANSTFQAAVQLSKHELVRVLIANGVDISTPGVVPNRISSETALFRAVENEDKEMISLLLEHGADISIKQPHDTNETVLHCAARISSEMARLVLKANISQDVLDAQNRIGQTALSYAIGILPWQTREFNDTTTLLLLEAGATIDQKLWNKIPQWFREKHAKYDPSR